MRSFGLLLRDGVRLGLLLRRPLATPLDVGLWHWLGVFGLLLGVEALGQAALTEPPRIFNPWGLQSALAMEVLRFVAVAVLVSACGRRRIFWTALTWSTTASLASSCVLLPLYWLATRNAGALLIPLYWFSIAWAFVILLRLAQHLAGKFRVRAFAAAIAALAISVGPALLMDTAWLVSSDWRANNADAASDASEWTEAGELAEPERVMYAQPAQLQAALAALAPQRPERTDLYLLAFGGDASEDVFRNEVEYVERLFAQRFDAQDRSLVLLNHPDSAESRPLATATNLERALLGLGERMDRERDILFLYLTSHGSEDHEIYVNQPPLALDQLTPERLRAALDASGIRWRVLLVSACYSGGYLDALRDPDTLVMTAARHDRSSFGCGSDSDITWFGRAYAARALNQETDFIAAFELARASVERWESQQELEHSEPQIEVGSEIAAQLQRWRGEFEPGEKLAFSVSEHDPDAGEAPASHSPDD